jgi:hypothetical protein
VPGVHVTRAPHAVSSVHWVDAVHPHSAPFTDPAMHAGPGPHVILQLAQAPPVLPQAMSPNPGTHTVPLQHPPLQVSPPVQFFVHVNVLVLHV